LKILLLEDNVALHRSIGKVLELDAHEVHSFYDGQDVLDNFTDDYDLFILDINVPNINGLELLELIHNYDESAKVIIISSNSDVASLTKAYNYGCVDYLNKPFHLEELRIKIDRLKPAEFSNNLSKKEKSFLSLLMENKGKLVDYEMIRTHVYKEKDMSMDGLRSLVRRTRTKLVDVEIENVIDQGYKIN